MLGSVLSGASSGASSGALSSASSSASSGQVRVHVIVRASGRQLGSVVHGSVWVHECIIISASGQAEEAACKSRDEIRLG